MKLNFVRTNVSSIPNARSAEQIQDEIFKKMPAIERLRLALKFSNFLLKLNRLNSKNGISGTAQKFSE
jgi:hypothetical protein